MLQKTTQNATSKAVPCEPGEKKQVDRWTCHTRQVETSDCFKDRVGFLMLYDLEYVCDSILVASSQRMTNSEVTEDELRQILDRTFFFVHCFFRIKVE